jgi:O-antigen/teichoic acid export membrane protein
MPPPDEPSAFEERILRRVPLEIAALAAILALAAGFFFDPPTGLFFFAGGLFSALGFAWLKRSLTRFLAKGVQGARRSGIALYVLRLVLICAVFFLIILLYPKKIIAFVAGFSTVVPVSLAVAVRGLLQLKKWKV